MLDGPSVSISFRGNVNTECLQATHMYAFLCQNLPERKFKAQISRKIIYGKLIEKLNVLIFFTILPRFIVFFLSFNIKNYLNIQNKINLVFCQNYCRFQNDKYSTI